jgi:hypothetical protein
MNATVKPDCRHVVSMLHRSAYGTAYWICNSCEQITGNAEVCDHHSETRYVGCGGRAFWICDACCALRGAEPELEDRMTLECGCVVADGKLEEPCPEHVQRDKLKVVKPGTPGYTPALPGGTVFVEHAEEE